MKSSFLANLHTHAWAVAVVQGMQRNPGFPTIEAELESALVKMGAISEQNAGSFMKVSEAEQWVRDKQLSTHSTYTMCFDLWDSTADHKQLGD